MTKPRLNDLCVKNFSQAGVKNSENLKKNLAIYMALLEFPPFLCEAIKPTTLLTSNHSNVSSRQKPFHSHCDFLLQVSSKLAHVVTSVNRAVYSLSGLEPKVTQNLLLIIGEDIWAQIRVEQEADLVLKKMKL